MKTSNVNVYSMPSTPHIGGLGGVKILMGIVVKAKVCEFLYKVREGFPGGRGMS